MKKVSVIIPMYNSEKFIGQCLDSVRRQTFQDLEILVMDDGSTDCGPEICKETARRDERIRLYRQENRGVSAARNQGMQMAVGDYLFFLDSDDMIHPALIEKLFWQAETQRADLVFCGYRKMDWKEFSAAAGADPGKNFRIRRQTAEGTETEIWFHRKYVNELSGIGGKLLRRTSVGSLRFDESLLNGEDTLFLYDFICRKIRAVYLQKAWYYYRIHPESVTQSSGMRKGKRYFESSRRIREREYQKGRVDFALTWERFCVRQIEQNYEMQRNAGNRAEYRSLRKTAAEERRHPMFERLLWSEKLLYYLCFFCYPVYVPVNRQIPRLLKWKEALVMRRKQAAIGILTFHCSNNFGAMLQAYGLKTFLRRNGKAAEIVRYEPIYMTGRHWWIPYAPIRGVRGRIWGLFHLWEGFCAHLRTREAFSRQRRNMNDFRYTCLVEKKQRKILSSLGLHRLKYAFYIVGSDQIWNPEITCGLRKAYFGAFRNLWKKKVISYAASFGSSNLPDKEESKFSKLIRYVDVISVREEAAVPYVERLSGKEVTAVLDPVFFLEKESWERVERIPKWTENRDYILLYVTEPNQVMTDYVKRLSQEMGLPVLEVCAGGQEKEVGFEIDYTAGPAELLGYIHKAAYVVSNSFHAVAFSILYEKQFLTFVHSHLGERVRNILKIHGLEERLCEEKEQSDIHAPIDWKTVRQKREEYVRVSGEFLLKNIEAH
ncbi:MAG: glycosyltransferase [Ruminococcus sp.]|nr:glycosyltransferase [Ruminococcus sp.]